MISGCVSGPPEVGALEYHYRCTGRFTFVNEAQAFSASYELSKYPARLEIQFWGPLGQGRTRLVGRDKFLTIDLPSGERIEGMDAEMIMIAVLGWSVPLDALSDWILGRPADEWPVTNHSPDSFTQLGWEIDLGQNFENDFILERQISRNFGGDLAASTREREGVPNLRADEGLFALYWRPL